MTVAPPVEVAIGDEMMKRGGAYAPTALEMKEGFVSWLKADEARAKLLECKLKTMLEDAGHVLLFTVAYACWSQPIELFWAAGKNPVAAGYTNDRKLCDVVEQLRGGWYGRDGKPGVRCDRLVAHAIAECNTRIPGVGGLEGTVEDLTILDGAVFTDGVDSADLGARVDAGVTGDMDLEDADDSSDESESSSDEEA